MNENFIFSPKKNKEFPQGNVTWKAPSNIALVKYWGKHKSQLPKNTSLSFTLNDCCTTTKISYQPITTPQNFPEIEFLFEGKKKDDFLPKINQFIKRILPYCGFLVNYKIKIETGNSFPHSSGIASSASAMASLALCVMSIENHINKTLEKDFFYKKASFLARLGSGSACRSIKGELVCWGEHSEIEGSTDFYGIPYPFEIHPHFKTFNDTILLVDKGAKKVSSTQGHELMNNHPYAKQRFKQANTHIENLIPILSSGNLDDFFQLVEQEALALHAMMMTANPYFLLIKPNTLKIIEKIWSFRKETNTGCCFTLDAGANVHLLYPHSEKGKMEYFIESELKNLCQEKKYLCDKIGAGAERLNSTE